MKSGLWWVLNMDLYNTPQYQRDLIKACKPLYVTTRHGAVHPVKPGFHLVVITSGRNKSHFASEDKNANRQTEFQLS